MSRLSLVERWRRYPLWEVPAEEGDFENAKKPRRRASLGWFRVSGLKSVRGVPWWW